MQIPEFLIPHAERFFLSMVEPSSLVAMASAAAAGLLVLVSAFVKTMIPLRWLAVASNVGFMVYGLAHPAPLMVALHAALLPVNLWRVRQMISLTRRVTAVITDAGQLEVWLRPYMRTKKHRAGTTLFELGDLADRLYFLAAGEIELPEVGRLLKAGEMFGEIAFFAPDHKRSSSAICRTNCTLLSIDEATFRQLIYQNPDFGLDVMRLITGRLTDEIRNLRSPSRQAPR